MHYTSHKVGKARTLRLHVIRKNAIMLKGAPMIAAIALPVILLAFLGRGTNLPSVLLLDAST